MAFLRILLSLLFALLLGFVAIDLCVANGMLNLSDTSEATLLLERAY